MQVTHHMGRQLQWVQLPTAAPTTSSRWHRLSSLTLAGCAMQPMHDSVTSSVCKRGKKLGLAKKITFLVQHKGPSTLATLFSHMWPRIVADPSTLGRLVAATCMLCMQTLSLWRGRATACRTLEPQTAVCSPKLENNGFLR